MIPGISYTDSPADGNIYGRQSYQWVPLTAGGTAVPEAPGDGKLYARQNSGWTPLPVAFGSWQPCTYPTGCSGTLQVRTVGDPTVGTLEVIGQVSSTSAWDGTYSFIVATLPVGLTPSTDRFALVPSSSTAGTPDSISCAWFKSTGQIAIGFIYEKGPNPTHAWFDAITIQM